MSEKHIREIKADGIVYVDEGGVEKFIDFALCYANYVKQWMDEKHIEHFQKINNLSYEDALAKVEKMTRFRVIGERQVLEPPWADGPYVEFHTEPPIRFKLTQEEYRKLTSDIHELSWKTFDRS